MFADRAEIYIRSGKGGDGHVSFRREIYVPAGGPDGGDGGRGGNLILVIDEGLNTLSDYRYQRKFAAQDGEPGGKKKCSGKDGTDLILKVPLGTIVREKESGKVIVDMSDPKQREVILKGGKGGKGNMNYATPTMQAPKYAKPGQKAQELNVILELKLIADVGLVGFPNVGKSTLLSRVSNAKPKIANYHFTTLNPNLGVVDLPGGGFVMADIPGLIEGASKGLGLGHEFLRHIERTKVMIHMVDAASTEGRDPIEDIDTINGELKAYNPEIAGRPQVIAANKTDVLFEDDENEIIQKLKETYEPQGIPVFSISAVSGKGIKELLYHVKGLLDKMDQSPIVFEREFFPEDMANSDEAFSVWKEADNQFVVEGPRIERMLGYTNLDTEKGFEFFQNFLKTNGILEELEAQGIEEGDTVRLYGLHFDYYK
ncbi:MAG: GTPase ObgE [Clostridiales bacterium]|nr:GTPase ObgE [Clostridiales bacterium]